MLVAPDVPESVIARSIADAFELSDVRVTFLPVGADSRSASYAVSSNHRSYFLKLRLGDWYRAAVEIPRLLAGEPGVGVIAPIPTASHDTSFAVGDHHATLYPFVSGRNAYERRIDGSGWSTIARTLHALHNIDPRLVEGLSIRAERFDSAYRRMTLEIVADLDQRTSHDETDRGANQLLMEHRAAILALVGESGPIARRMAEGNADRFVPCHGDLHAGNVHIGDDGASYIVDWDELILAPPERDLMSIGCGLLASGLPAATEAAEFYRWYGHASPDPRLMLCYRIERILADIVEFVHIIRDPNEAEADRGQSLIHLHTIFDPKGTIETLRADT